MPTMEAKLGIDADRIHIRVGDDTHPVSFGEVIEPNAEYKIRTYSFQGEKGTQADGCVFEITPHGSTTVMRVVDESARLQEVAIKGSGWFLGVNPEGQVIIQEARWHEEENPLVEQMNGWVGVWIAGAEGLEVLDVTEPPFKPSMETSVVRDDQAIPPDFWEKYDVLKSPPAEA